MAQTNVWAPVGSPGNAYDYQTSQQVIDAYAPPSPTPSNQSRNRFTAWFSRSRSGSPADGDRRDKSRSRSRSKSPNLTNGQQGSPSSFVVRNVVRQSGGVSWDPADVDGDAGSPHLGYKRSKSKPLGGAGSMSLGVPPGGPGGGTGYGTALSSNDGRPEPRESLAHMPHARPMSGSEQRRADDARELQQQQQHQQQAGGGFHPPARPVSPGHTKAAAFQRPRSQRSPSPAPSANSQRERANQHRFSVSPGPKSWSQQQQEGNAVTADMINHPPQPPFSQSGPVHMFPASIAGQPQQGGIAYRQQQPNLSHSPQQSSPLSQQPQAASGADRIPGFDPSQFRAVDSSGSLGPTPAMPGKRQSVDARAAGFGFMGGNDKDTKRLSGQHDGATSPGFASKIRGFFNTPTRNGGQREGNGDDSDDDMNIGTPYGVSPNAYQKAQGGVVRSGGAGGQNNDVEDREAEIRRQKSHREAVRLIDQEREAAIARKPVAGRSLAVPSLPSGIARELAAEGWTPEALQRMTEDGRQNLVRRLTANGKVSRETSLKMTDAANANPEPEVELNWENLTPAQRIIAETRSRQLEREKIVEQQQQQQQQQAPAARKAPPPRDLGDESREVPVRRGTRSPKKQPSPAKFAPSAEATATSTTAAPIAASTPTRPEAARRASVQPAPSPRAGLAPGTGPMPADLGLMGGLQEMMTRFYRYERYSVPLLRAIEMRLVDIERDAQMAQHHNSDAASDRSGRTQREKEMDKWVGQMTALMRHEIGQLQAATKEIREGREMLSVIAKNTGVGGSLSQDSLPVSTKASQAQSQPSQLTLPPGAAPALDKDQGKAAHGQQAPSDAAADEARARARSTSPNGRPKYTNALGMPLADGRKSPERAATPVAARTPSPLPQPPSAEESFSIEAQDETTEDDGDEDTGVAAGDVVASMPLPPARSQAISPPSTMASLPPRSSAASPPLSDVGSTDSSTSRRREISVNDRLKKLMSTTSSRSATSTALAAQDDGVSAFTASSSPQELMQSVQNEVDNLGLANSSAVVNKNVSATHLREGSNKSHASSMTVTPARNAGMHSLAPPVRSTTSPQSSPASPTTGLIGGRTSPSPLSYASNAAQPGQSGFGSRQGSTSPGVPNVNRGDIKTSNNASSGLRARAQSYLLSADGSPNGGTSAPGSPTPLSHNLGTPQRSTTGDTAIGSSRRSLHKSQSSTHSGTPPLTINKQKSSYFANPHQSTIHSSSPVGSTLSARERARSSPAPAAAAQTSTWKSTTPSATGTKLSTPTANKAPGTMTLKERVAFFEVSANK